MRRLLAVLLGLLSFDIGLAEQTASTNAPAIAEPGEPEARPKPKKSKRRKKRKKKKPINWSEWENVR